MNFAVHKKNPPALAGRRVLEGMPAEASAPLFGGAERFVFGLGLGDDVV